MKQIQSISLVYPGEVALSQTKQKHSKRKIEKATKKTKKLASKKLKKPLTGFWNRNLVS